MRTTPLLTLLLLLLLAPAPARAQCASPKDCKGGRSCVRGECVSAAAPGCQKDADCAGNLVCEAQTCVAPAPAGAPAAGPAPAPPPPGYGSAPTAYPPGPTAYPPGPVAYPAGPPGYGAPPQGNAGDRPSGDASYGSAPAESGAPLPPSPFARGFYVGLEASCTPTGSGDHNVKVGGQPQSGASASLDGAWFGFHLDGYYAINEYLHVGGFVWRVSGDGKAEVGGVSHSSKNTVLGYGVSVKGGKALSPAVWLGAVADAGLASDDVEKQDHAYGGFLFSPRAEVDVLLTSSNSLRVLLTGSAGLEWMPALSASYTQGGTDVKEDISLVLWTALAGATVEF